MLSGIDNKFFSSKSRLIVVRKQVDLTFISTKELHIIVVSYQ